MMRRRPVTWVLAACLLRAAGPPTWAFGFLNADADLDVIIYGTNASILVKGLPVLPWFPILGAAVRKERQTGFLFPAYGTSSRKGYFIEAPFFWAIADNQ